MMQRSGKKYASAMLPVLLVLLLTGCQMTQSAFARTANNAGAAFAAASTTLTYAHTGKLINAYAQSSFENYQSELSGLDQQLPAQSGAPNKQTLQQLLTLSKPALQAIQHPCLTVTCDWQAQIKALNAASAAFLKAGGS